MNLYIIERTDEPGWGQYEAAVVAAPDAYGASHTHPHHGPGWDGTEPDGYPLWTSLKNLKVTRIGKAYKVKVGVVLASFRE